MSEQKPVTPAAEWREKGEPDPHGNRYECERDALALGHITDDALANGAYMNYDQPLDFKALAENKPGYYSPICWMTAVKDRIRWLSRRVVALEAAVVIPRAELEAKDARIAELEKDAARYRWLRNESEFAEAHTPTVHRDGYSAHLIDGPDLDKAIDAAIAGENR